jgi:hypothetical protein
MDAIIVRNLMSGSSGSATSSKAPRPAAQPPGPRLRRLERAGVIARSDGRVPTG